LHKRASSFKLLTIESLSSFIRQLTNLVFKSSPYVPYRLRSERHQIEYRKNKSEIARGVVPARYVRTAEKVPGQKILDIGSADGTLALVLAQSKQLVIGSELMRYRHRAALQTKNAWSQRGVPTDNVRFVNRSVKRIRPFLKEVDTVVISRALYHFREDAFWLFRQIEKSPNIHHVALFGNREKEREWLTTRGTNPGLGKYLALATQNGMEDILTRHGFTIEASIPSTRTEDPVVIGVRKR
jgi:hypothetical protein